MIFRFIKQRLRSFPFAFQGIKTTFQDEPNIRVHLFFALMAIFFGILLKISSAEWLAVTIVIGMVFTAELMNTAIENTVNLLTEQRNIFARKAKDAAAAAVLFSAFVSVIVGLIIFLPKLINLFV